MTPNRWVMIIMGTVAALVGASLVVGGATLLGAQLGLRDADGFYTSPSLELSTDGYALVLPDVDTDLEQWAASPVRPSQVAAVRVTTTAASGRAVFVGIARHSDVDTYLAGVAHDDVVDVTGATLDTRAVAGGAAPAPPEAQSLWVASSGGTGAQDLTWRSRTVAGRWWS